MAPCVDFLVGQPDSGFYFFRIRAYFGVFGNAAEIDMVVFVFGKPVVKGVLIQAFSYFFE
mgnify:CR=1 FL=1